MNDNKQWHGGKGSQRRGDGEEAYQSNWDRIFGGIDYGALKDKEKGLTLGTQSCTIEEKDNG